MKIILVALLIGSFKTTAYRSVPQQTDSSPYHTATGEHVCGHGIAVSRNLLSRWGGPLHFGDTVYIQGVGVKVVNDVMGERNISAVDVWVSSYDEEHSFHKKFCRKKLRLWKIEMRESNETKTYQANSRN